MIGKQVEFLDWISHNFHFLFSKMGIKNVEIRAFPRRRVHITNTHICFWWKLQMFFSLKKTAFPFCSVSLLFGNKVQHKKERENLHKIAENFIFNPLCVCVCVKRRRVWVSVWLLIESIDRCVLEHFFNTNFLKQIHAGWNLKNSILGLF